jgi:hypothetical protein
MNELLGLPILPAPGEAKNLLLHVLLNLCFTTLVLRFVYFRLYHHRDYIFPFFTLNTVTFAFGFLLSNVRLELGLGLGLFGIFGIMRYRTEEIEVRDLTYLFVVIGIGLLNALSNGQVTFLVLLSINTLIVGSVWILESLPFSKREACHVLLYDQLTLLGPGNEVKLLEDLRMRTHLPIVRYVVGRIDLLRDTAEIAVYCPAEKYGTVDMAIRN